MYSYIQLFTYLLHIKISKGLDMQLNEACLVSAFTEIVD